MASINSWRFNDKHDDDNATDGEHPFKYQAREKTRQLDNKGDDDNDSDGKYTFKHQATGNVRRPNDSRHGDGDYNAKYSLKGQAAETAQELKDHFDTNGFVKYQAPGKIHDGAYDGNCYLTYPAAKKPRRRNDKRDGDGVS